MLVVGLVLVAGVYSLLVDVPAKTMAIAAAVVVGVGLIVGALVSMSRRP